MTQHHVKTEQVCNPSISRVAALAREYDRWCDFYRHVGNVEADENADQSLCERSTDVAVRRMQETMDELEITPAMSLADFGLKARIVHEFMYGDWYSTDRKTLNSGEAICRSMMAELIAINGMAPIALDDFTPTELMPGYVESRIDAPPASPEFRIIQGGDQDNLSTDTKPACFVANMAASFKDTLDAFNTAFDGSSNEYLKSVADNLEASMRAMLDAVPYMEAASAAGSVFQLAVANYAPEIILEYVDSNDPNYLQIKEQVDRIQWALWSVRTFIEAQYGVDGRDLGCDYNMPTTRNPFQCVRDLTRSDRDEPKAQTEFRQAAE